MTLTIPRPNRRPTLPAAGCEADAPGRERVRGPLEVGDVARLLGCSQTNVRRIERRAVEKLRERLAGEGLLTLEVIQS